MHFTWASVKGFGILSSIEAKSCSQYSMTRKTLRQIKRESSYSCLWNLLTMFYLSRLLPTTTSLMATIFSCWQFNSKVISRMALSGSPSFSLSIRIFFSATTSPFRVSLALSKNELALSRFHLNVIWSSWWSYKLCHRSLHQCGSASQIQRQICTCPAKPSNKQISVKSDSNKFPVKVLLNSKHDNITTENEKISFQSLIRCDSRGQDMIQCNYIQR